MIAHRSARPFPRRLASAAVASALVAATLSLSGCFPLAATGVAVGVLAATDRRTIGTQTEDTGIEVKAASRLREELKNAGGISVTSFNRKVLLTGQVAEAETKTRVEQIVKGLPNVSGVHNELQVSGRTGLGAATADTAVTAKVKTALIEDKDVPANSIKVVTESSVVYLMGLVSRNEGDRAARVASRVSGVTRVVTLFEYIGS